MNRMHLLRLLATGLLVPLTASARVNLVTLPDRDTVQLTIYNSADLTMVKETRHLTFRKGVNRLEFSWANTLIDPTSVEFRPMTQADKIEVLDVRFPPRVTNLLEWRIQSEYAGDVVVEIRYFTSGVRWSADYVADADKMETAMNLAGYVRVSNDSGEDYENAQVRLVVGNIHLVDEIAELARRGRPGRPRIEPESSPLVMKGLYAGRAAGGRKLAEAADLAELRPREIIKEGVSEYFLYTVEGRDTIPTGWSKRLPSFSAEKIPLVSYYKFETERWGDQVRRFYRFKNDAKNNLGKEPLPDGSVHAVRTVTEDGLYAFVGNTDVKYIPLGEQVDLDLGSDPEVRVEPKLMNWEKVDIRFDADGNVAGWTTHEAWTIEVQNSKDISVVVDIRRNFAGDWTLDSKAPMDRVDADTVKFVLPLKPREQQTITYDLTTRYGVSVQK